MDPFPFWLQSFIMSLSSFNYALLLALFFSLTFMPKTVNAQETDLFPSTELLAVRSPYLWAVLPSTNASTTSARNWPSFYSGAVCSSSFVLSQKLADKRKGARMGRVYQDRWHHLSVARKRNWRTFDHLHSHRETDYAYTHYSAIQGWAYERDSDIHVSNWGTLNLNGITARLGPLFN